MINPKSQKKLAVDVLKKRIRKPLVVVSRVVQLEASTQDKIVTENFGEKLAVQIVVKLKY